MVIVPDIRPRLSATSSTTVLVSPAASVTDSESAAVRPCSRLVRAASARAEEWLLRAEAVDALIRSFTDVDELRGISCPVLAFYGEQTDLMERAEDLPPSKRPDARTLDRFKKVALRVRLETHPARAMRRTRSMTEAA